MVVDGYHEVYELLHCAEDWLVNVPAQQMLDMSIARGWNWPIANLQKIFILFENW